jgi:aromatic ring-opening dioxygenase LigB subunit
VPLVYACIAPHGGEVIPALSGKKSVLYSSTTKGMRTLAVQMREARPDTVVIASPHNLRLQKHIGVVTSEYSSGKLTAGTKEIKLRARCDVELAKKFVAAAEGLALPVVAANFGALEGPMSDLPMDWGTLVPLWFLLKGAGLKSKIVIVTPSRGIPLRMNFDFGKAVAEAAEEAEKRVAFVASADQAHAHLKSGPYGFDPRAKEYDRRVMKAIQQQKLDSIMGIGADFVEAAKPDSLWQLAILAGALAVVPMKGKLISYQVPTYYGMLCASYHAVRRKEAAHHSR